MPSPGLTELEAVNSMLGFIGEAPIASLDGELITDAALARNILREASRQVQEVGWHFNTDVRFRLSPDINGFIQIPNDALRIDCPWVDIVVRGSRIYNRETNSYTFTTYLDCEIIRYLEWDDLPPAVRRYITAMATTMFATRALGSAEITNQARAEEAKARALMLSQEFETSDASMLDNWDVAKSLSRSTAVTI
jgi:hypothetical protein